MKVKFAGTEPRVEGGREGHARAQKRRGAARVMVDELLQRERDGVPQRPHVGLVRGVLRESRSKLGDARLGEKSGDLEADATATPPEKEHAGGSGRAPQRANAAGAKERFGLVEQRRGRGLAGVEGEHREGGTEAPGGAFYRAGESERVAVEAPSEADRPRAALGEAKAIEHSHAAHAPAQYEREHANSSRVNWVHVGYTQRD